MLGRKIGATLGALSPLQRSLISVMASSTFLRRAGLVWVLAAVALSGCATVSTTENSRQSAKHAAFDLAEVTYIAPVLTLVGGSLDRQEEAAVQDLLRHIEERMSLMAATFDVDLSANPRQADVLLMQEGEPAPPDSAWSRALEAYSALIESTHAQVRRGQPLNVAVPPDVMGLAAGSEARHLLFTRVHGWGVSPGALAASVGIGVLTGLLTGYAVVPYMESGFGVEMMLVDAAEGRVVWFSQHNTTLNPNREGHLDAVLMALFYELHTGRRIAPQSFGPWPSSYANVWLRDGERLTGRFESFEGMNVVLRGREDEVMRVPLTKVSRARSVHGGVRLFPAQSSSNSIVQLF